MNNRVAWAKDALIVVALFGLVAIVIRLFFGLGVSTALSDAVPWGLWKILNMVAGVALATGGFTLACTVYVFGLEKYRPLLRPAILIAFLGYGSSCFALFLDIGLPHRIWHAIVYWNEHSFLFEVAWCVMLYFTVTIVEMSPILLEKFPYPRLVHALHRITIPVVIAGITFSTLHHSSLGSLFLVAPGRLHAIWFTSMLPVLFFVSAVGGGMMAVVLLNALHAWLYRRQPRWPLLQGVALAAAVALALHAVVKVVDFTWRGTWGSALDFSPESLLLLLETLLISVLPCLFLVLARGKEAPTALIAAASCAVVGVALNRLNVGIFGFLGSAGTFYSPSATEWALSLGVFAMAGLAFLYIGEWCAIFDHEPQTEKELLRIQAFSERGAEILWHGLPGRRLAHVTLLPVLAVPLAVLAFWNEAVSGYPLQSSPVSPPTAADPWRETLRIDGNRNGDFVVFDHARHQRDFGQRDSCQLCHHVHLPGDSGTSCYRCHQDMHQSTPIFDHQLHVDRIGLRASLGLATRPKEHPECFELPPRRSVRAATPLAGQLLVTAQAQNRSCAECHDRTEPESAETARRCTECHGQDMGIAEQDSDSINQAARGYVEAFHGQCITCHQEQAVQRNRPELPDCETCHPHVSNPAFQLPSAAASKQPPFGGR